MVASRFSRFGGVSRARTHDRTDMVLETHVSFLHPFLKKKLIFLVIKNSFSFFSDVHFNFDALPGVCCIEQVCTCGRMLRTFCRSHFVIRKSEQPIHTIATPDKYVDSRTSTWNDRDGDVLCQDLG